MILKSQRLETAAEDYFFFQPPISRRIFRFIQPLSRVAKVLRLSLTPRGVSINTDWNFIRQLNIPPYPCSASSVSY